MQGMKIDADDMKQIHSNGQQNLQQADPQPRRRESALQQAYPNMSCERISTGDSSS